MQILQSCTYGNEELNGGGIWEPGFLGRKKGRSFAERPKSREETPKVGCGGW